MLTRKVMLEGIWGLRKREKDRDSCGDSVCSGGERKRGDDVERKGERRLYNL